MLKVHFTPNYGGGLLYLINYETVYSTPELCKTGQITPSSGLDDALLQ
jgi:hypothetical protein